MTPRLAATYVLYDVMVARRSLSATLAEHLHKIDNLADRGLCQEIVYGTLRYYPSLQQTLNPFLNKKIINKNKPLEIILCMAIYQLYHLKLPSYAVINESVTLVRPIDFEWASGFINAVLRKIAAVENPSIRMDKHHDHPAWLAKMIRSAYPEQADTIFANNHHAAYVMLRTRPLVDREHYIEQLTDEGIDAIAHIDNKSAIVLRTSTNIAQLPTFSEGGVTVQDANAQLAANLLGIKTGMRILDACAAPGGKTAHIADKAENLDITAIDIAEKRVKTMLNTFERLDINVNVVTADLANVADWHDGQLFDRILLDAPCSATGVIRKHPDILFHRREADIEALQQTQAALLDVCWGLLKPGGLLLYATCSILPDENYQAIEDFLTRTDNASIKPLGHNRASICDKGTLQFLPDEWGDGFFYAALLKSD